MINLREIRPISDNHYFGYPISNFNIRERTRKKKEIQWI